MTDESSSIRLNKHLALVLGLSRREADQLIEQGRVTINDTVATLGARFLETDTVKLNGKVISQTAQHRYFLFNKPIGYVCSRHAQGDAPTIYSLLPKEFQPLKTVGRLDKDSSGLILLTNDGDFAYKLTHPKFKKIKIYKIILDRDLEPLHQQMISDFGIQLEDGKSRLLLERSSETDRKSWQVTMSEGRNRQIRRTFNALGYTVAKLHRIQFGLYLLHALKPGQYTSFEPAGSDIE